MGVWEVASKVGARYKRAHVALLCSHAACACQRVLPVEHQLGAFQAFQSVDKVIGKMRAWGQCSDALAPVPTWQRSSICL